MMFKISISAEEFFLNKISNEKERRISSDLQKLITFDI